MTQIVESTKRNLSILKQRAGWKGGVAYFVTARRTPPNDKSHIHLSGARSISAFPARVLKNYRFFLSFIFSLHLQLFSTIKDRGLRQILLCVFSGVLVNSGGIFVIFEKFHFLENAPEKQENFTRLAEGPERGQVFRRGPNSRRSAQGSQSQGDFKKLFITLFGNKIKQVEIF